MSEWKTIDSAPRDGTAILVAFAPDGPDPRWAIGEVQYHVRLIAGEKHGWYWTGYDSSRDDEYGAKAGDGREPSHWMPLPAPPSAEADERAADAERAFHADGASQ